MHWKFWKTYTLTSIQKLGRTELSYTVTAPTKQEAIEIMKEMQWSECS